MKRLLLATLILLLPTFGTPATRAFKAGNFSTDTASDIICLKAVPSTGGKYDCFELNGVNYQVPAGKTLYITQVDWVGRGASTLSQIVYGTDAKDDSTAPTGVVKVTAETFSTVTAMDAHTRNVFIPIPTLMYPHAYADGAGFDVTVYGYVE